MADITRQDLINSISKNIKILRAEYNYSQQEMANTIGLSKKTLIQIEKNRLFLSWTATLATCAVFRNSKILQMELGEDPVDLVETLSHEYCYTYEDTDNRNYIFWDIIEDCDDYCIKKNVITEHYKIIDKNGKKYCSSFDFKKISAEYNELKNKGDL